MTPVEARKARDEAHDRLRDAIRAADLANLEDWRARRVEAGDDEDVEYADSKLEFIKGAVLADYIAGTIYVALDGEADYHAVLTTDSQATRHRFVGLAKLTLDWLTDV
jgi:hypothetical protein